MKRWGYPLNADNLSRGRLKLAGVAIRGWENRKGQRANNSLSVEFDASQEQNPRLLPSITRSFSAEIARGKPLRPSPPIEHTAFILPLLESLKSDVSKTGGEGGIRTPVTLLG